MIWEPSITQNWYYQKWVKGVEELSKTARHKNGGQD
jgi:hypothetical protein